MRIKKGITRASVKAHRKVFGKAKEIAVTTGKGGLTKAEITKVLGILRQATKQGLVPQVTYEYRPPTFISRREMLFLKPIEGSLGTATAKIRKVLKARFGANIMVSMN